SAGLPCRAALSGLEVSAAELRAHLRQAFAIDAAVRASQPLQHLRGERSELLVGDRRRLFPRAPAELLAKLGKALRVHRRAALAHLRAEFGPALRIHAAVRV